MFECKACQAKDAEIARLWKRLEEAMDRFQALTGTLSELANNRIPDEPEPETGDQEPRMTEDEWREAELTREAQRVMAGSGPGIVKDFPR